MIPSVGKDIGVVFRIICHAQGSGLQVKRGGIVERLLVGLGGEEAIPLHGVDMHKHGMVLPLGCAERLDKRLQVVAVPDVDILISKGLEDIVLRHAVALAEGGEMRIERAVVFGYRHLVVVEHHDEIGMKLRA